MKRTWNPSHTFISTISSIQSPIIWKRRERVGETIRADSQTREGQMGWTLMAGRKRVIQKGESSKVSLKTLAKPPTKSSGEDDVGC